MPAFIPDLSVILAFGVASLVLALSPGPDMALFVSRTINHGRAHGMAAMSGAITGILCHALLAAFGVSLLLIALPTAFFVLKIVGALYLLYLAVQAVRHGGGITLLKKSKAAPRLVQSYMTGIGINLTNPKIILFFVTFLPQFVSPHDPYAPQKLLFLSAEFVLVALPVVITIIFLADWVAVVLTRSKRAQNLLNWSFAAVFAGFAATILMLEGRR